MKILQTFLFVAALFAVVSSQETGKRCFENMTLGTSEVAFTNIIKDSILNKEVFDASCLHVLIERGFYKAAIILFEDYFLTNNIDLHETTLRLTQNQKRDLDKFISTVMSAKQPVQQIEPVVKWAQSQDNIFLHIKLSMRPDSPACLHCKVEKIEFTNSTIFLSSFGIQSHQPLRFLFNLTLFDEIDPDTSTWNQDSVGTLFFNLTKMHKVIAPTEQVNQILEEVNTQNQEKQQGDDATSTQEVINSSEEANNSKEQSQQQGEQVNNEGADKQSEEQLEKPRNEAEQNKGDKNEASKELNDQAKQPATNSNSNNTEKDNISNKIWLRLEKTERKKDIPIWWEIRDRYSSDMDQWDKLCAKERENKKKKSPQSNQPKKSSSSSTSAGATNTDKSSTKNLESTQNTPTQEKTDL